MSKRYLRSKKRKTVRKKAKVMSKNIKPQMKVSYSGYKPRLRMVHIAMIFALFLVVADVYYVTDFVVTGYYTYVCGNNVAEGPEYCDGTDLLGESCGGIFGPGSGGTLICKSDCSGYDTSSCIYCGDGAINSAIDEICDGTNLNSKDCTNAYTIDPHEDRSHYGGTLACGDDCTRFDTRGCSGFCGDDLIQSSYGETCDGKNLNSQNCISKGFTAGDLRCYDWSATNPCTFDTSYCTKCGNNVRESGETCDGTDFGPSFTCSNFGFALGTLACKSDCSALDTSDCTNCGNNAIDAGEVCDGTNLNSKDCTDYVADSSYIGGTLACKSDCTFDTSSCTSSPNCGNGLINIGESCDGSNLNSKTCSLLGFYGGTLDCKSDCTFDTSSCTNCGNNFINPGEVCDGTNLNSKDCTDYVSDPGLQYDGGTLSCKSDCTWGTSNCRNFVCGDGIIDSPEICDGTGFGGKDCTDFNDFTGNPFESGTLSCSGDCRKIYTSQCYKCGNNRIEISEVCDGTDLNKKTCIGLGFYGGTLDCKSDCTLDTSSCTGTVAEVCGNGKIEGSEKCDASDLNGKTCVLKGFDSGTLKCDSDCEFDTSSCYSYVCGNNVKELGEVCDGTALGGKNCANYISNSSFVSGTLKCRDNCLGVDTSGCLVLTSENCGNGKIDSGEDCDGTALGGETCESHEYESGTLACKSDCTFDTSSCTVTSKCGDGKIDSGEDCDGTALGGYTCIDLGYDSGELVCTSDCILDIGGCFVETGTGIQPTISPSTCGNGIINSGEQCDGTNLGGLDCSGFGFDSGTLRCDSDCLGFDTNSCTNQITTGEQTPPVSGVGTEPSTTRRVTPKKKFPTWVVIIFIIAIIAIGSRGLKKKKKSSIIPNKSKPLLFKPKTDEIGKPPKTKSTITQPPKAPLPEVNVSAKLVAYVKRQFIEGYKSIGIKKILIESGYSEPEANTAIRKAKEELNIR